ncbi:hypothetical protein [Bacillus paramycoides]|uniref:hypothetical protein n=1 Tax=Bacillus paramycoides TaxID=2026194 RepID=UPI003D1A01B1
MNLYNLLVLLGIYIIFFLICTESIEPLLNRIDEKKRKKAWLCFHFALFLVAILYTIIKLYTIFASSGATKAIIKPNLFMHLTVYIALIAAMIPYTLFLYELIPNEKEKKKSERYRIHFHLFVIAIFSCLGIFIGRFNPSNLIDSLSFFMFLVSLIVSYSTIKQRKRTWIILYYTLSIASFIYMTISLLIFIKVVDYVPLISESISYISLVAAIISYALILYELKPKVFTKKMNNDTIIFIASIFGIFMSTFIYIGSLFPQTEKLNPSDFVDLFSFISFGILSLFYYKFDE